jgi:uncharacterized protein YbjT (DUF2867 family)
MKEQRVLLLGSTGLVGSYVLDDLIDLDRVSKVYAPTRRSLPVTHSKLENPIINFDELKNSDSFFQVDVCICCLGTTIKKAGSQEAFKKIDHDLVISTARNVHENGCENFFVISSVGADSKSSNFYLKTKGEMEENLRKIGFKNLQIINPSLIIGKRNESRPLESLGQAFMPMVSPIFIGPFRKYRPVKAEVLAKQLVSFLN